MQTTKIGRRAYFFRNLVGGFSVLILTVVCGCTTGDSGPPRAAVSGQVTLDGQAVESGAIVFMPTKNNTGPTVGAEIHDGRYELSAQKGPVIGSNRVDIRWPRKTGKKLPPPSDGMGGSESDELVEVVPAIYNRHSTLIRDVEQGANTFDFSLTSQPGVLRK
ncbi:MAG: hypothetical protein JXM70_30845 [Pirellulales bacterium]|nr:hypothetical protein [Pirellulales bacterium]